MSKKRPADKGIGFAVGLNQGAGGTVTARLAGELVDLKLNISPVQQKPGMALRHLAKAINLALQSEFIETPLDVVFQAARVRKGSVQILHRDYIGLGDGVFASIGKAAKSFQLTLRGPDAGSPEGRLWVEKHGSGPILGVFNLFGRKLNLLQEFEDKVPVFVEQTLDRLESRQVISNWNRDEWNITTTTVGLNVMLTPV